MFGKKLSHFDSEKEVTLYAPGGPHNSDNACVAVLQANDYIFCVLHYDACMHVR